MKKILAIIVLIMSLFMTPLFAADMDKTSEQGKKIKAILEESARKKAEFEERKREEDLAIKTREELEVRKQQELQKKIDELKAQEERVAAEKKTEEKAEVAKQKKLAEDPRKQIADALEDLFTANKKYAAADAETNTVKKADYIKSGDALFKGSVAGLHESLKDFSYEEIKKIVSTMELKPETQFMVLQNLIEAYVDRPKAIEESHGNVFGDFISALLDTVNVEALPEFLVTEFPSKANPKKKITGADILHNIQILMLPLIEAPQQERLFATMVKFTEKLVEILNKASTSQREHLANVLLNWVRVFPMTKTEDEGLLLTALKNLKADSLDSNNTIMLRDWLLVFKNSKNEMLLDALRSKYLKAAYANGTVQALHEAILRLQGKVSSYEFAKLAQTYLKVVYADGKLETIRDALRLSKGVISFPELIKLQKAYLVFVTKPEALEHIGDIDIPLIIDAFKTVLQIDDEKQWTEAQDFLSDLITHLDALIGRFEKLRENLAGTVKFAEISEKYHISELQTLKAQLEDMVLPKSLWKNIADLFRSKKTFEPDITKWDQKLRARLLLNITDANYQNDRFVSVPEFVKALQAFAHNYHFYEGSPAIQKVLLDDAKKYLFNEDGRKFFDLTKDVDYYQRSALYELIGLDYDLLVLLDQQNLKGFRDFLLQGAVITIIDKKDKRYIQNLEGIIDISAGLQSDLIKIVRKHPDIVASQVFDALSDKQFNELLKSLSKQNWSMSDLESWEDFVTSMTNAERFNLLNKLIESKENEIINRDVANIIKGYLDKSKIRSPEDGIYGGARRNKMLMTLARNLDAMSIGEIAQMIPSKNYGDLDFGEKNSVGRRMGFLFEVLSYMQNIESAKAVFNVNAQILRNTEARKLFNKPSLKRYDERLEKLAVELEKRLKAQQESEAKEAKAAAATSASSSSTSSASSNSAPSASASSSSANVTASGSTSTTSLSVPALSRGIGALTQTRS